MWCGVRIELKPNEWCILNRQSQFKRERLFLQKSKTKKEKRREHNTEIKCLFAHFGIYCEKSARNQFCIKLCVCVNVFECVCAFVTAPFYNLRSVHCSRVEWKQRNHFSKWRTGVKSEYLIWNLAQLIRRC